MKQDLKKKLRDKKVAELLKDEGVLRNEIAKLIVEQKVNPSKDTNQVWKKRKELAVLLTIINEK